MKLLQNTTFAICLLLVTTVQAQRISGKGEKIVKNHTVQAFSKLTLSGVFSVTLKQGNINKVSVEAQPNLFKYIIIEENDGHLDIHFKKKFSLKRHKKIRIDIVFTDLQEIESNIVGNINTDGTLNLESLAIDNSSVGNMDLSINVKNLDLDLNAVGNIHISGKADKAKIESSIVGNLDASDLYADFLSIDNSSVGNVRVYADVELAIDHSGIGSLHYYGDAHISSLSSSGIGRVKQH